MWLFARVAHSPTVSAVPPHALLRSKALLVPLGILALGGIWFLLARLLPVGADYYWWYYRIPQDWLAGDTRLYDDASRQFFCPPWAVWLFLLFAWMEMHWAMAAFTMCSIAILAAVSYSYAAENGSNRPWLITLLVALCPFSLAMLFTGTPDAWSLLGIFLCQRSIQARRPLLLGGALLFATIRPQNVVLLIPAFLLAVRRWPKAELAQVAALPSAVLLASFLFFGIDWPLRWWESYRMLPPSPRLVTSIYTTLELFGIPVWVLAPLAVALAVALLRRVAQRGLARTELEMVIATNAILVPYMRSVSYVVLLALPWTGLAARRPRLAATAYVISLPTIVVPLFWERLGVLDVTFPIVLLGLLVLEARLPVISGKPAGQAGPPSARGEAPRKSIGHAP